MRRKKTLIENICIYTNEKGSKTQNKLKQIMIFHKTSVVIRCQSEKLCKDLVHVKKTSYHSNRSVGKVHLILALNHRPLSYL